MASDQKNGYGKLDFKILTVAIFFVKNRTDFRSPRWELHFENQGYPFTFRYGMRFF